MAARWVFVIIALVACKKHEQEPEAPAPTGPVVGHSVTKKKVATDEGEATPTKSSSGGAPLDGVTAISVGSSRACAIANDQLWCWQNGDAADNANAPAPVLATAGAQCALLEDKSVWCPPHRLELSAAGASGAGQITASATDVCASRRLFVWCWKPDDDKPRKSFDWGGVDKIVVGSGRACSIVSGDELECLDLNADDPKAQALTEPKDVVALAMSGTMSCTAKAKSGAVECWTDPGRRTPISGVSGATELALGPQGDACAIVGGGGVTCWKVSSSSVDRPAAKVEGVTATAIGVGGGFACALGEDKKVRCWSTSGGTPEVVKKR